VHGATLLLWGIKRGAKLPPLQDERPQGALARGTRAHLASGSYLARGDQRGYVIEAGVTEAEIAFIHVDARRD